MEVALRLGDLADLTVSNEAGPLSVDVSATDFNLMFLHISYALEGVFAFFRTLHVFDDGIIHPSKHS